MDKTKCYKKKILTPFLIILSPFAPFISEELWEGLGHKKSISLAPFPEADKSYLKETEIEYPVSFNGKKRFTKVFGTNIPVKEIEKSIIADSDVMKFLSGQKIKRIIIVPKKIINIVINVINQFYWEKEINFVLIVEKN